MALCIPASPRPRYVRILYTLPHTPCQISFPIPAMMYYVYAIWPIVIYTSLCTFHLCMCVVCAWYESNVIRKLHSHFCVIQNVTTANNRKRYATTTTKIHIRHALVIRTYICWVFAHTKRRPFCKHTHTQPHIAIQKPFIYEPRAR